MGKATKKILPILGLLVLLGGAIGLYYYSVNKNKEEKKEEEEKVITLYSEKTEDIKTISYKYKDDEVILNQEDGEWVNGEDSKVPVNQLYAKQMGEDVSNIEATQKVTDDFSTDDDEYGFSPNSLEITVTNTSGDEFSIYFGNESISGGGRYAYTSLDEKVLYMVPVGIYKDFCYKKSEMIDVETFPKIPYDNIVSYKAEPKGKEIFKVELNDNPDFTKYSRWKVVSPFKVEVPGDEHYLGNLLDDLEQIAYKECVSFTGSEKDMKKYGIDEPSSVVTIEYKDTEDETQKTLIMKFGKDADKGEAFYIQTNLSDSIYKVSTLHLENIADPPYINYVSQTFLIADEENLEEVTLNLDGKEKTVKMKDGSDDFLEGYRDFMTINPTGFVDDSVTEFTDDSKPECSAVFKYKDYEDKIEFYKYGDGNNFYMVSVNGSTPVILCNIATARGNIKRMMK